MFNSCTFFSSWNCTCSTFTTVTQHHWMWTLSWTYSGQSCANNSIISTRSNFMLRRSSSRTCNCINRIWICCGTSWYYPCWSCPSCKIIIIETNICTWRLYWTYISWNSIWKTVWCWPVINHNIITMTSSDRVR